MGPLELELKGVIPDPAAARRALLAGGATLEFRGMLHDRRYDRDGEFRGRDEVVRSRRYVATDGATALQLGWKGPTRRTDEGYKEREEREIQVRGDADSFLAGLGLTPIHAIDRYIEVYALHAGHARLEWYPRMDVLVEVEGAPDAIEAIISILRLPRDAFTSESLTAFTSRYDDAHPDAPSIVSQDDWEGAQ